MLQRTLGFDELKPCRFCNATPTPTILARE